MNAAGRPRLISAALSPCSQVIRAGCPLFLSIHLGYAFSSQTVASQEVQKQLGAKKPPISQKVKFIDQLRIVARGGQGGGGSSALFGRTGHHPRAAGGSGAPGGSVVLRATTQLTGLGSIPLHVEAERGGPGGKQWMDGKKGADKVVQVPPGTMVWRLVQLRGAGAATPHGVTSVPVQHSTTQHTLQEPQGQEEAATLGVGTTTPTVGTPPGSSSRPQHRKLFSSEQLQPESSSAPNQTGDSAASNSSTSSSSMSHESHTKAAWHHTASHEEHDSLGSLYDDLLHCRQLLSNKEKLELLHYGSLGGPAAGSMITEWADSSEADDLQDDSDSSSDTDAEGTDEEEGSSETQQQQQQQHAAGDNWKGLGEYGDTDMRQFDKQQVWSILMAQAELLGVLESEGQELVVAQGGRGGRGNAVAPSNHQRPASKVRSDGQIGQEVLLFLQLRLMADVALVGLPNVGKSSLIAALTGARAQVGSYAFTTLRPQLGALLPSVPGGDVNAASDPQHTQQPLTATGTDAGAASSQGGTLAAAAAAAAGDEDKGLTGHRLVLADLPGLVPGAHAGKGRGMDFLKHLQKARCIAVVIDMTGQPADSSVEASGASPEAQVGQDSSSSSSSSQDLASGWEAVVPYSPEQQLNILLDELRCYDANTLSQSMLIVANKVDAMSAPAVSEALQRLKASTSLPIVPVSAQQHLGLSRLAQSLQLLAGGK